MLKDVPVLFSSTSVYSGFLGTTTPHTLNSAPPNAVLNSLNSAMSPLHHPSNPTPPGSLWPSALASTQGWTLTTFLSFDFYLFFYLNKKKNYLNCLWF